MNFSEPVQRFLFPEDRGTWLAILRLGLGVEILLYMFPLRGDWGSLFGSAAQGLLGREVGEAITLAQSPAIPRLGWIVWLFHFFGAGESVALSVAWWGLLVTGGLLLLGLFVKPVAILAWFLQLACAKSGGLFSYGADNLITIGLFYLMIAPGGDRWSLDHLLRYRPTGDPSLLGFHHRVLQIHLCFIYFFGGLAKCLGAGWWDGSNLWRSLTSPPFDSVAPHWIASVGILLPALGASVCLLEATYPFFIWGRRTRLPALGGICALHLGIGLFMGMYLFAGIMLVFNLAAFGPPEPELVGMPRRATDHPAIQPG